MTDSDEEISISQNSKNHNWYEEAATKKSGKNKTIPHNITINFTL